VVGFGSECFMVWRWGDGAMADITKSGRSTLELSARFRVIAIERRIWRFAAARDAMNRLIVRAESRTMILRLHPLARTTPRNLVGGEPDHRGGAFPTAIVVRPNGAEDKRFVPGSGPAPD
ncbi:MAG: hypothetical protein KGJ96_11035, partial [Xanthomonadaceae bacterium]|nr:hypothetical protein [Xanthomonadaceae bacterium]